MARPRIGFADRITRLATTAALAASLAMAQNGTQNGEWRFYGGDDRSTKYSPLEQIHAGNVKDPEVVWRWNGSNYGPRPQARSEMTPLMAGGVLYFTAGTTRTVIAADAATGETLWTYRLAETGRGSVRQNNRGVTYWSDGQGDDRILVISPGYQLLALNAQTGRPIESFGENGLVDLWLGLDRDVVEPGTIGATSPAIVVRDVVVVGAALGVGVALPTIRNTPGYIRGFDVRTGEKLWTFKTIPREGEFGNETWEDDSWRDAGNTGAWGPLTADEELGYVYIPVEMPSGDLYGGHRHGDNLFGDSLVCLDARTGKRVWHYQLIHHDVWDWDIPAAPVLLDVTVDGRPIRAVAQVTKQAFTYVFDRVTGEPVWPIEEREAPQSDVPGERTAATQPIPTKPAPFDRQGVTLDDLVDFTPEIKAEAVKVANTYKLGPLFTPPIVLDTGGKRATLMLPGAGGGANWQSAAGDPETGILYVPSTTSPYASALVNDPSRSEMRYIARSPGVDRVMGLPLIKPPWSRITAINLNTGNHAWMVANGEPPDDVKNHPALGGVDTSQFGGNNARAGLLVTKTLVFAAVGDATARLRALDKATGRTVADITLPAPATAPPMTYSLGGRQYIVVSIAGQNGLGAELAALALPEQK